MNTTLLTVDVKVAGAVAVRPVSSKPSAAGNLAQFFTASPDNLPSTVGNQIAKFNSALVNAQCQPAKYIGTSDEEVIPQLPQEGQDKAKSGTQIQSFLVIPASDQAQLTTQKASAIVNPIPDKGIATKIQNLLQQQAEPKPPATPAWLINMPPNPKFAVVALPSPDLNATKPILTGIDQTQTKADVPPNRVAPNITEMVSTTAKTDAPDQKTPVPDKIATSGDQKIPPPDTPVPTAQPNTSLLAQSVSPNTEKYPSVAGKPIDNKAAAGQKGQIAIVSESADSSGKKSTNNLLADSALQKLNVTEVQISTRQAKNGSRSDSNGSSNSNFDQLLAHNDAQIAVAQQSSAAAEAGQAAGNAYPGDVSADVTKQIMESIYSSLSGSHRQITIRLNPPELGKVFIKLQEHDAQITGLLEVSKTQTRYEIEQALPQIIQNLQDSGIQIKRLEVVLAQQTDHYALTDQSQPDGWLQQHNFTAYGTPAGDKSPNEWLTDNDSYQDKLLPHPQITDSSINILI